MNAPEHYDSKTALGLADYGFGNLRIEAAIRHALGWLPANARRILDVECGIGWSSAEIQRFAPQAHVLGIDLNPQRIELARKLFPLSGLSFESRTIPEIPTADGLFDAVVMLDVYEHIPKEQRQALHLALRNRMSANAVLILSCPTASHQECLRLFDSCALQPVDESVTPEDLQLAARDLEGAVIHARNITVLRTEDCCHAVIRRGSQAGNGFSRRGAMAKLEPQRARYNRVNAATAHRITRGGVMLPNEAGPRICVMQPDAAVYSETFIKNHLERLPARVSMLYGFPFPARCDDESRLVPLPLLAADKARRSLPKPVVAACDRFMASRLESYLKRNGIDAVLAEYGTTGAAVAESCNRAGVPFVVHFHGFDAYVRATLDEYAMAYRRMFAAVSGLVAVSQNMKQQLVRIGAPAEKVHYIPYGVDVLLFAEGKPAAAPPAFVAVGRFVDKKAPHLTLLAFAKTAERAPAARLIMIGNGPLLETAQQLSRSLGIRDRVEFTGPRRPEEVAATLRSARALVQHSVTTSYGDSEGMPNTVLEAGATGLPVIATRHAGIKDAVLENETGFLVDEGDVNAMAEHMIRLAEDSTLAASMGARARQHIAANFSLDQSMRKLWTVMEEALKAAPRRRNPKRAS